MPQVVQTLKFASSVSLTAVSQLCRIVSKLARFLVGCIEFQPFALDDITCWRLRILLILSSKMVRCHSPSKRFQSLGAMSRTVGEYLLPFDETSGADRHREPHRISFFSAIAENDSTRQFSVSWT